jgi:hypothetical protein
MTPVKIAERRLVGLYKHQANREFDPLYDVEIKCCASVVMGCDT